MIAAEIFSGAFIIFKGLSSSRTKFRALSTGGIYLSYSGGYIDDIKDTLEEYKAKIISGEIVPPSVRP